MAATRTRVTRGYICGKVRRFAERVYGEDRLLYPAIRKGTKGDGVFTRVSWDEALDHIAERMMAIRDRSGAEAILPFCYGGSNGLLTQDTNDAALWRGFGTSRLARTVCAAPTGAANMALYGKMPGVTYEDYVHARLIVLWGVNPSASGIHLFPSSRKRGRPARSSWSSTREPTALARQADLHIAVRPGTDVAVALAMHNYLFDNGYADRGIPGRAHDAAPTSCARAPTAWTIAARRRGRGPRSPPTSSGSPSSTRAARRRSCAAAGDSNAIATAAAPSRPCSRCQPWRASSVSAAAASR